MEDEDEDQENEKKDERDCEECRVESRRLSREQHHADDTWMTCAHDTLSQCHVQHVSCETRENVTSEGVLFTLPRRLQQIAISCKRSCYNKLKNYELQQFSFHCHHEVLDEEDGEWHF